MFLFHAANALGSVEVICIWLFLDFSVNLIEPIFRMDQA